MDNFAKKYLIGLCVVALAATGWWLINRDTRVAELNAMLAADQQLAAYPYPFRVLAVDNGVAQMTSPRSADVPVMRFLRVAFVELRKTPVDHPDMMAAQDTLAAVQSRAAQLVQAQDDIEAVRWVLDERWYNEHGVFLDL